MHIDEESPVDWRRIAGWMTARGLPGDEIADVQPIGGGTQNVMFEFSWGGVRFVIRRGPLHLRDATNTTLRREVRVLTALAGTAVPVPVVVAAEADESVLGSVFYLMEPVDGFNASTKLPTAYRNDRAMRSAIGFEAISALAQLASVDPEAVGLSGFGRPEGFLERQVPRWSSELQSYAELNGYAGHRLPHVERLADWLTRNVPPSRLGIMHGDFHIANLMFCNDRPAVAAIVDWEMSTLGDPLVDLGWFLITWPQAGSVTESFYELGRMGGLPSRSRLIDHYADQSGRPVDDVLWYAVMASFKLAIVLEGTYARACAGKADTATGQHLHGVAVGLLDQAVDFLSKGL